MKIEPIEYLVTFDDEKDLYFLKQHRGRFTICDGLWFLGLDGNWHAGSTLGFTMVNIYFHTKEEALEALKKWKEMQDETSS